MHPGPQLRVDVRIALALMTVALISSPPAFAWFQAAASSATAQDMGTVHQAINNADWRSAERDLHNVIAVLPSAAEPQFLLGYVLFREQRAADSLAAYTEAARLRAPTADDLVVIASDYVLMKDYADAERWLILATQKSPANPTAWYLLGRTQYTLDHTAAASESFERNLLLTPKDVRAEYNLGLTLEKLGRPAEAEAAYRNAIEWQIHSSTRDPQPYLDLGMLLLSRHHPDQALAALREAVELGPKNALAYQELGLVLEALGHHAEAVTALERAIALAPGAEQPHFLLGRVYRRLGRNADAATQFALVQSILGTHSNSETPNDPTMAGTAH